jgi:hypothetical protein
VQTEALSLKNGHFPGGSSWAVSLAGRALRASHPGAVPLAISALTKSKSRLRPGSLRLGGAIAALREFLPGALGPASRLRRRYADAPAGAPLRAFGAGRNSTALPARLEERAPGSLHLFVGPSPLMEWTESHYQSNRCS